MKEWKVTRVLREEYYVWAATRQEALDEAIDPCTVGVMRETAVRIKDSPNPAHDKEAKL